MFLLIKSLDQHQSCILCYAVKCFHGKFYILLAFLGKSQDYQNNFFRHKTHLDAYDNL